MRIVIGLLCLLNLAGCSKDPAGLPYAVLSVPEPGTVRDLHIISPGNFLVCGGNDDGGFVLVTHDDGQTWSRSSGYFQYPLNCLYFLNADTGFCADGDIIIFRTVDGGSTWYPFEDTSWPLTVNRNLRDIAFNTSSSGFVCGGKNFGNGVLYQTDNAGQSWTYRQFAHEYRGISFADAQNGVMCGYGSLLVTRDGGHTFSDTGNKTAYYTAVCADADKNYWMCDFNGGIYRSSDLGATWKKIRDSKSWNPGNHQLTCIALSPSGRIACAGPNGFITWSDDKGASWNDRESFGGNDILNLKWSDDHTLMAVGESGVYRVSI